jgi:hypothetical protein
VNTTVALSHYVNVDSFSFMFSPFTCTKFGIQKSLYKTNNSDLNNETNNSDLNNETNNSDLNNEINNSDLNNENVKVHLVNENNLEGKPNNSKINTSLPKFDFLNCFSKVKHFLDNKPINNKTQEELEELLYDTCTNFIKESEQNFLSFPTELRLKIFNLLPE